VNSIHSDTEANDLDGLRLVALGRIPRCADCDLYRALLGLHADGSRPPFVLPQAPADCSHKICAPLAARLSRAQNTTVRILRAVQSL
jgi:hypothetical protein